MDYEKIKSEIKDIITIVKECPENLQEECFRILLNELLENSHSSLKNKNPSEDPKNNESNKGVDSGKQEVMNNVKELEEEIALKDLHAKTKRFMESNELSIKDINKLYYKADGKILPIYDSLGSNKLAESQVRLGLLTAFESSMDIGEFEFDGEVVRERCKVMKSYDKVNFATNFKKNKILFDGFEQYEKDLKIKLSPAGKTELAKLLKELAK